MDGVVQLEKTLALIKPDAVAAGKAEEIMQLIELAGFTIIAKQRLQLTPPRAEAFYAEHYGKAFFPGLVAFMTSGPIWALVLTKENAILEWRSLMGPTNTQDARAKAPKSMRALYGTDGTRNATHGSDSRTSAAREVKIFFPAIEMEAACDSATAQQYIAEKLQPTLVKALTALAKQKPATTKSDAVRFLAQWMLANNPNKPRVVQPAGEGQGMVVVQGSDVGVGQNADGGALKDPLSALEARLKLNGAAKTHEARPKVQEEASLAEQDQAAVKVQAAFRGHQARQQVHEMKDVAAAPATEPAA